MLNTIKGIQVFEQAVNAIVNPSPGLPLAHWKKFSEFIGGLRMKEFTIFCGATGAGKTQWLANVVAQLITSGVKVYVAPVETGTLILQSEFYRCYRAGILTRAHHSRRSS